MAFASVGAQGLSTIAADTLFVSTFSLGELSRFYVIGSVVRVASALLYAAAIQKLAGASERRAARLDGAVIGLTALLIAVSGVMTWSGGQTQIYAVNVALLVLPPLLPLIAFNHILSCFHARQAKRLLPLVAAAATVGSIFVSAGAGPLALWAGTPSLFFVSAVVCLVAAPLPRRLFLVAEDAEGNSRPAEPEPENKGLFSTLRDTVGDIRGVPVVRVIVSFALIGAALGNFADYALKASLKASFGRDEIAAYLGAFGVATNLAIVVAQLFLSSRFVGRLGVRGGLSATPAALIALAPGLVLFPMVVGASLVRFVEMVGRYSLGNACADLLLIPADRVVRMRAKVVVKGMSSPLGFLISGLALTAFGETGPSPSSLSLLLAVTAGLGLWSLAASKKAYAAALASAIGRGVRLTADVTANAAAVLRAEFGRWLRDAIRRGDAHAALRTLDLMSDRFFDLNDIKMAVSAEHPDIRAAGIEAALRVARPGDANHLLDAIVPSGDPATERRILIGARNLGGEVPEARLLRALEQWEVAPSEQTAALWAEALTSRALSAQAQKPPRQAEIDASVKQLRKAALGEDQRQAPALIALGDLKERRAEREVLRALGSRNPAVFAAAASTAVRIEAASIIPSLVIRLTAGPYVQASARALAMAGPAAINELIAALPTTRGDAAVAPTAVASGNAVSGTVRAARVLSRLGPEACTRVLKRFSDLGYRARDAVAHSFATLTKEGTPVDETLVLEAIEVTLRYAEQLVRVWPVVASGNSLRRLCAAEVSHRLSETSGRIVDLASVIRDRALIERTRAALCANTRERSNALELLENILPRAIALRVVKLLEHEAAGLDEGSGTDRASNPVLLIGGVSPDLDGWLKKCHQFDEGTLPSSDPMRGVLEKVLVLRDASLFVGLSGEELYPVAEIARAVRVEDGDDVFQQGDPGDALYVIAEGKFAVIRDERDLRVMEAGEVFGEMALLDGSPRAATVRARAAGELYRIPRAEFEALLDESPELTKGVIRTLLTHLRGGAKQSGPSG